MGLFDFLKKKEQIAQPPKPQNMSLEPLSQEAEENLLSDLPPIEGSSLPPLSDMPSTLEPPETPLAADSNQIQAGVSVNIPPMDFSASLEQPKDSAPTPFDPEVEQDINQLFISDDEWKEPDWTSFEPYTEPAIEEPKPEDFGLEQYTSLPSFDESAELTQQPAQAELEITPPTDEVLPVEQPLEVPKPDMGVVRTAPLELYVKGSHYRNVFSELSRINELLKNQDPRIDATQEFFKDEDSSLGKAKDNMEYIYKRLMVLDKKIFTT